MSVRYNGENLLRKCLKKGSGTSLACPEDIFMIEGCEQGIKYIGVRHEMTAAWRKDGPWPASKVCTATAGRFTNDYRQRNSDRGGIPVLCLAEGR